MLIETMHDVSRHWALKTSHVVFHFFLPSRAKVKLMCSKKSNHNVQATWVAESVLRRVFKKSQAIHLGDKLLLLSRFSHVWLCACDPIDGSPPSSPIPGILQARILEWVAISFSNAWKWKVKVKSLSRVQPTLCDPMDCSLPGSSIHGIFQARVLEWGAIGKDKPFLCLARNSLNCYLGRAKPVLIP